MFFFDHLSLITLSPDQRDHRAGSQLKKNVNWKSHISWGQPLISTDLFYFIFYFFRSILFGRFRQTTNTHKTNRKSKLPTSAMPMSPTTFCIIQGIARTQSPTNKNDALELPTFGVIVGVSPTEVQWKSLALEEPPSWSWLTSAPGKYAPPESRTCIYDKIKQFTLEQWKEHNVSTK